MTAAQLLTNVQNGYVLKYEDLMDLEISEDDRTGNRRVASYKDFGAPNDQQYTFLKFEVAWLDLNGNKITNTPAPFPVILYATNNDPSPVPGLGEWDFFKKAAEGNLKLYNIFLQKLVTADAEGRMISIEEKQRREIEALRLAEQQED